MSQDLVYRNQVVSVSDINKKVGINKSPEVIADLLTKMCLKSEVIEEGRSVTVEIPPTRAGWVL